MADRSSRKLVRSYRLVFRRRWRIFKLQNWRIPLPNGIELRAVGYWATCLLVFAVLSRLPLAGEAVSAIPPSVRLLALPIASAWALSRWEVDGRSPHRALLGLLAHCLRPRDLAGLRRCPTLGSELVPVERLTLAPDPRAPTYPRGRITGPASVLLRYQTTVEPDCPRLHRRPAARERVLSARRWQLRHTPDASPLHRGKVLEIPTGKEVIFE